MIKSPDEALSRFNTIWKRDWISLSEADTRCKIIDPLLIECLNWDEGDIIREEHSDSGFVDYIFKINDRPLFIIEAKKEGDHFIIPDNFKNRLYKINGVISKCKELISAIEQAQKYCIDHGIRVGIVTNGYQYVIFEAFRLGSPWKEGRCIIYHSFEDISHNFGRFWDLLNKNSVDNGFLLKEISEKTETKCFERPLDKIHNKEEKLTRNYLHEYISPFVDYIFGEITDPSQLGILEKCYVYEKAYGSAYDELKSFFMDRMPYYSKEHNIKSIIEEDKDAGEFRFNFEKCDFLVKSKTVKGSMILLLGGVGAGKTTFLHRFFRIILKDETNFFWFYVNFGKAPIDASKIEEFIYQKIIEQFEVEYYKTVRDELDKFSDKLSISIDKNNWKRYVFSLFAALRCLGYSISLAVDNVDQHDAEMQEKIFLETEHITDELRLVTILTLREETYYRSTLVGPLDAYDKRKFYISSPKFELVILNRIDYLLDFLKKNPDVIKKILKTSLDLEDKIEEIVAFFKIIKYSLKRKKTHKAASITYFVTQISAGNMRVALRMFNAFLQSGNTKVDEMLYIYEEQGVYMIHNYQFLKSVILGDSRYYIGDKSFIMNLFEINPPFSESHFLNQRILNYAYINRGNQSPVGRGYIEINRLKSEAENLFINPKAIEESLLMLAKFDLICLESQSKRDLKTASYFCLTFTGSYYLTQLTKRFIYLDLIAGDTPIADINVVKKIKKLIDSSVMEDRFKKTEILLNYLKECEDNEFKEHPEYKSSDLTNERFMGDIIVKFWREILYIQEKIEKKKKEKKLH